MHGRLEDASLQPFRHAHTMDTREKLISARVRKGAPCSCIPISTSPLTLYTRTHADAWVMQYLSDTGEGTSTTVAPYSPTTATFEHLLRDFAPWKPYLRRGAYRGSRFLCSQDPTGSDINKPWHYRTRFFARP